MRLGALCLLSLAAPLWAGMPNADCRSPFVYAGADVNIVVLPYRSAVQQLSRAGEQLTLLMQTNALFSLLRYSSIGAVRIVDPRGVEPSPGCEPETIIAKLLGQRSGAERALSPGKAAVFLWGSLYEEEGEIYLRSYLRFVRRPQPGAPPDQVLVGVNGRKLAGRVDPAPLAFAPRRLTKAQLSDIDQAFRKSMVLRSQPNAESTGNPLPMDPSNPYGYYVGQVRGDWMEVLPIDSGPRGWVHADVRLNKHSLSHYLPEMHFAEGIVGYLMNRGGPAEIKRMKKAALEAIEEYEDHTKDTGDTPEAAAVAKMLTGAILVGESSLEPDRKKAHRLFKEAVALAPESADARNLELMLRLQLAYDGQMPGLKVDQAAAEFVQAAALDPQSSLALANLDGLYSLVEAGPPRDAEKSSLPGTERLQRLHADLKRTLAAAVQQTP